MYYFYTFTSCIDYETVDILIIELYLNLNTILNNLNLDNIRIYTFTLSGSKNIIINRIDQDVNFYYNYNLNSNVNYIITIWILRLE